jgi:N-acetylneuraminic acid mutarotase
MLLSTSFKADLFMTHVRRIRPIVTGSLLLIALLATPLSALASGAGTIGTWQFDSDLSASTAIGSPSVAYNGYMYRFGGDDFSTAIATVQYAAINSNGSLGTWTNTTSLPANREWSTAVTYNGYVYVMGGSNGTTDQTSVYYAPLNPNGTVGSWTSTTALPLAVHKATSVVYNGYVYTMGGYNGSFHTNTYYAPLNSNGTVGTWTATTALPIAMSDATAVAYNGRVYHMAGFDGAFKSSVYSAPLSSSGIGTWTTTTSLPAGMNLASAAQWGGYVYVMGGQNSGGILDTAYSAQLRADGTVGPWQTSHLSNPNYQTSAVAYNGYLYQVGDDDGVASVNGVYYAALTPGTTTQTLANAVDAKSVTLTAPAGTDITCSGTQTESSQAQQDAGYSYPVGLARLCFTTPATNNQVTVTFVTSLKPSQVVARHYNATTGQYTAVAGASITQTTLGGQPALSVTYTVADNGVLDEDAAVGAITDPIGLAVSIAPATGLGAPRPAAGTVMAWMVVALLSIAGGLFLRVRQRKSRV